ncbi:OLC1v1000614C1 [Oldenlandia corymbosa var. corymbosa]|nr:OLC1v1000614C1 [Oldenlandia corymbosa var. corymbosa]
MAGKWPCLFPSASAQDLRCFEMEKEKLDQSSPRGVIEACITDLEKESDSPKKRCLVSTVESKSREPSRWHRFFKLWKQRTIKRLPSFPPLVSRRRSRNERESIDIEFSPGTWKNFTHSDLKQATNNFSQENLIGKGGYAEVYKGCLPDGQLVAIKQLNKGTAEEQIINFLSEVGIIAHVDHPNTAKMIGYGIEGGTYLVLELSSLGSLGSLLHGSKEKLNWEIRYKIILGTADGLRYLHENCQRRIIHRDIKADNILLTENYDPQICDFGLAKWLPKQMTHCSVSKFEGTFGYFAPEYYMNGVVDEKTDVFAFGVLLLEIITGRRALDESQNSLVLWARPLLDHDKIDELVDPSLGKEYNKEKMDCVLLTASLCINFNPTERPQMNKVVALLRGEGKSLECLMQRENQRCLLRTYSEELLDADEYNSTKYLCDHLMHVALSS